MNSGAILHHIQYQHMCYYFKPDSWRLINSCLVVDRSEVFSWTFHLCCLIVHIYFAISIIAASTLKDCIKVCVTALTKNSTIGKQFIQAIDFAQKLLPTEKHSVIAGSIVESMKGKFGFASFNAKTKTTPVWLSALTSLYWFFELDAVARAKPYLNEVLETDTIADVADAIERTRNRLGVLPRADIPI